MRPLVFALALLLPPSISLADDFDINDWQYPSAGQSSGGTSSAGKAGDFRKFTGITSDSIEDVVLWYGEKVGISNSDSLLEAAESGFANAKTVRFVNSVHLHDTTDSHTAALVSGMYSSDAAHFMFHYVDGFPAANTLTISLTKIPTGASISIIHPIPKTSGQKDD